MRPYRIKSATKMINNVELDGYGIYFAGVLLRFVYAFNIRLAEDQVERANDLFDMQLRNKNEHNNLS